MAVALVAVLIVPLLVVVVDLMRNDRREVDAEQM
jgi:hypothetical protein